MTTVAVRLALIKILARNIPTFMILDKLTYNFDESSREKVSKR